MIQGKQGNIGEVESFNLAIQQLGKELARGQRTSISNKDILRYWNKIKRYCRRHKVGC